MVYEMLLWLHIFIYAIWWVYMFFVLFYSNGNTTSTRHDTIQFFEVICNAIHAYIYTLYTNEDSLCWLFTAKKMGLSPSKCWRVECRGHKLSTQQCSKVEIIAAVKLTLNIIAPELKPFWNVKFPILIDQVFCRWKKKKRGEEK